MEAVREKWTDERLDDMSGRMGEGFERLDKDIREVRSEVAGLRDDLSDEATGIRAEMRTEFSAVRAEMGANHRTEIQLSIGTIGTVVICFLGLLLSHA